MDIQLNGQKFVYSVPTGEDYIKDQPIEVGDQIKLIIKLSCSANPENVEKILRLPMMDFLKYLAAVTGIKLEVAFLEGK